MRSIDDDDDGNDSNGDDAAETSTDSAPPLCKANAHSRQLRQLQNVRYENSGFAEMNVLGSYA